MRKVTMIVMMAMMMTSCGNNSREDLFHAHIKSLVDETYQVSDSIPFEVTGRYTQNEDRYQMELIFDRAKENFFDITILLIDNRQDDYKDSPFNLGYFNENKLNFVNEDATESGTSRKAYRFNWVSTSYDLTMKIAFTHIKDETREEIFLNYTNFKLYNEVSHGN